MENSFQWGKMIKKLKVCDCIFLITIFLLSIPSADSHSQWVHQTTGTTAELTSVKFINKNTGWVCGYGIILKTTNAGENWINQTHPAESKRLMCIYALDSITVYCVGYYETILKTTNGGSNWVAIRNGPNLTGDSYLAAHFVNVNSGWISGMGQKILKTTNGGLSLDSIYQFIAFAYDIYFKDLNSGVLCGNGGEILKTTNGGYNWFLPNINLNNQGYDFKDLSFVNNQYGWIIGQQANPVYRTTDFGQNWDSVGNVTEGYQIYCVCFSSINTGWCGSGGIGGGRLFKTTNSGYTWIRQLGFSIPSYVFDVYFYNDSVGWAVGGNGMILHTTSSGVSFVNQISQELPSNFYLKQNYPNPFNSETKISFSIPSSEGYGFSRGVGLARLTVFDISGREIETLVNKQLSPGTYSVVWNAADFPSGVYFCRLQSGSSVSVKKMVLIK
jgi:photosystem II stability/assembly factor-like uncharacterized protein